MVVVFNNVSKGVKEKDYTSNLERIEKYKTMLIEYAVEFYCEKISDETLIGDKTWLERK